MKLRRWRTYEKPRTAGLAGSVEVGVRRGQRHVIVGAVVLIEDSALATLQDRRAQAAEIAAALNAPLHREGPS